MQRVTFFITAEASLASIKSVGNAVLPDKIGYHQLQNCNIFILFCGSSFPHKDFWKHEILIWIYLVR